MASYVDYKYFKKIYGPDVIPKTDFDRLVFEACRRVDIYTTNKLKFAFPTNEDDAEAVKRCVCRLIQIAAEIEAANKRISEAQEFVKDEGSGALRGKVISSVSSGSESVSYTAKSDYGSTIIDSVVADKEAQDKLYADTIKEYLSGVPDANGVNLLYAGL